jgi:hypothetical protein
MGSNVIIRRDNSGSVTVEITLSAEHSDALVAFLTVAASAIQGGSPDIRKSPEAETDSLRARAGASGRGPPSR